MQHCFKFALSFAFSTALLSGCADNQPKLPTSYSGLESAAGKYSATRDSSGALISETFENNDAAYRLCMANDDIWNIWKFCSPFIYGELDKLPKYAGAKSKYFDKITPPDPSLRLMMGTAISDENIMMEAIKAGADVNKPWSSLVLNPEHTGKDEPLTPIAHAYKSYRVRAIKLLLENGANVNTIPKQLIERHSFTGSNDKMTESLDLILKHGYDINYETVEEINDFSTRRCNKVPQAAECNLKNVIMKHEKPRKMWEVADSILVLKKLISIEKKTGRTFEEAGLYYTPALQQVNVKRKQGMKVCLSDGDFVAIGFIDNVSADKIKILISGFYPKHITSMNIDQTPVSLGSSIWGNSSDWLICEKI